MKYLIDEYNNSPHSTLSQLLKRPTTPNEVHENKDLETKIVIELWKQNLEIELQDDYKLKPGTIVRVYNEASSFDKVKPAYLKGFWEVIQHYGAKVKLKQNNHEIIVHRWMFDS